MVPKTTRVLFLTPWYPSSQDMMSGLFVEKHVNALRQQGLDVRVIHSLTWRDTWNQYKALKREGWLPDIVQLNVIQKQGLLALWLKKHYSIPYVIVEHWSGYLPENGQFMNMSPAKRKLYQLIAKQASTILSVSDYQAQAMKACGIDNDSWGTIDNVVDDFFIKPSVSRDPDAPQKSKILLHVSCFDEKAKNVKGLLRAAKMLSDKRQDWKLILIGTGVDYNDVRAYARSLDIPEDLLLWTGELTPREVADYMHKSDALVLSSRYETYGVVLAESVVAGLPILSTPVGIAPEVADLIVPQEIAQNKPGRFAEFIETILWNTPITTHKTQITNRFTADEIGRKLVSVYEQVLSR